MENTQPFITTQGELEQGQQQRQQSRQEQVPNQQINQPQTIPMQIQNTTNNNNQNIPETNIQNNQIPQDEQQGEVNQDEQIDQPQQALQNNANQKEDPQLLINKDNYINKLEGYLNKVKLNFATKSKQYEDLNQDNKKTKQTLKKIRFQFLSSKQQISSLTQQKSDLQKENEMIKKVNQDLNIEIGVFKQAGDVNYFKNKIKELQKLLQIQKQQLKLKQTMIDQKQQLELVISSSKSSKIQILSLLQKYEKQNRQLSAKYTEIIMINTNLQNQKRKIQLDLNQLKLSFSQTQTNIAAYKQNILQLQQTIKLNQDLYNNKLKLNQESINLLINQKNKHVQSQGVAKQKQLPKNPQEKYGIRILNPIQQRDLILKEFIQLEIKYQSTIQELSNLRERHYHTLREIKNISTTHIHKKQYSQLYKKYIKLRKCLENSLINQQTLRKQLKRYNSNDLINDLNQDINQNEINHNSEAKYRSIMLEQPENAINLVEKIMDKSSDTQKHFFTLKQQLQMKQKLMKNDKQIRQKDQKIQHLSKEIQNSKNLIQLYDNQLTYKNQQLSILRVTHQDNIKYIYQLENKSISKEEKHKLLSQIDQQKLMAQILQVKSMQSLKQNAMLKSQKQVLTQLYNNLKSMYQQILNRQPQLQTQKNKIDQQKQNNQIISESAPCKQCQLRQEKLKQIKFLQIQVQTEGLAELYFKQIKYLLTILKKFPQKVDDITGKLESQKSTIHDVKKRYDQVTDAYGVKYRQLEEQKKANDQWRLKQRQQIREQFQQIRDILMNERLVTALRKAKSLIEYYQQIAPEADGEQIVEQGEYEQANEKNQTIRQEPVEQQKQNA